MLLNIISKYKKYHTHSLVWISALPTADWQLLIVWYCFNITQLESEASCPFKVRGTCPLRFLRQVDFECSFQKTKNSQIIFFYIWYNHTGVIRSFSASYLRSLAGAEPETDAFVHRCIITNHTRFCWAYECNDQSEAFRWVIADSVLFTCLLTELSG